MLPFAARQSAEAANALTKAIGDARISSLREHSDGPIARKRKIISGDVRCYAYKINGHQAVDAGPATVPSPPPSLRAPVSAGAAEGMLS